jgi:prlF antitoxin for toxin YhaV_toxin
MLVKSRRRKGDPVMEAFLSFLAGDMARSLKQIKPLDQALAKRIDGLVGHLPVNPDEDLGDESLVSCKFPQADLKCRRNGGGQNFLPPRSSAAATERRL